MSTWHGGKGSKQRPSDTKKFQDNYDAIFGKKQVDNKDETSEKDSEAEDKNPQSTVRPG